VTELEGLSRGNRDRDLSNMTLQAQARFMTVSADAKLALQFLKSCGRSMSSVRCVTPSGKVINSFTNFALDGEGDKVSDLAVPS